MDKSVKTKQCSTLLTWIQKLLWMKTVLPTLLAIKATFLLTVFQPWELQKPRSLYAPISKCLGRSFVLFFRVARRFRTMSKIAITSIIWVIMFTANIFVALLLSGRIRQTSVATFGFFFIFFSSCIVGAVHEDPTWSQFQLATANPIHEALQCVETFSHGLAGLLSLDLKQTFQTQRFPSHQLFCRTANTRPFGRKNSWFVSWDAQVTQKQRGTVLNTQKVDRLQWHPENIYSSLWQFGGMGWGRMIAQSAKGSLRYHAEIFASESCGIHGSFEHNRSD